MTTKQAVRLAIAAANAHKELMSLAQSAGLIASSFPFRPDLDGPDAPKLTAKERRDLAKSDHLTALLLDLDDALAGVGHPDFA